MTFHVEKTSTDTLVDNWPYDFQKISSNDPLYDYLGAYVTQLTEIDDIIEILYNQRFIDTASDEELGKLGEEVSIHRQTGETDDDLRFRIGLRKLVAASDGTASEIETIIEFAFGESALSSIDVTHDAGHPVTNFNVPSVHLNDIPITQTEFEDELERAFPAGHGVNVIEGTVWRLGQSGSTGLGQGGLI